MKCKTTIFLIFVCVACTVLINSCRKNADELAPITPIYFNIPAGFPAPSYNFQGNPLTQQGFELGKKLFYDGRLSIDGNFPCASCHQQLAAFATYEHDLSHGYNNQFTTRNAPGLFNLVWQTSYQWDGGKNNPESVALAHISAPNEMADNINNVVNKLKSDSKYRQLFKAAFRDEEVNAERMLKALTQFTGSMVSANSKYDKVKRSEASFTLSEQSGYTTFQAKCASCHTEPLFTDQRFRNIGLPLNSTLKDYGRMNVTRQPADSLRFKVPGLRNVLLTSPYMHDGRFWSLDEVLNHYSSQVQDSPTVDPLVKNNIPLTIAEKTNLKFFLASLTDTSFVNDKRFAAPQ